MPSPQRRPVPLPGLLFASAVVALTGCGSLPRTDADAPARGLNLGVRLASEAPFSAERAISGDPIVARYIRYTGSSDRAGKRRSEIRVINENGSWATERWLLQRTGDMDPELERRVTLSRGADGSVLLRESKGGEEALTTVFDPPVRIAGGLMRMGETIRSEFRVRIIDESGKEIRTGEGRATVQYAGRQRVETPMGAFDAELLMTDLVIDSGVATVTRRQRQWIATIRPGRTMIVAEDVAEQVKVLGFSREQKLRLVIESIVR